MPRILFLITEDWYFWTHRLNIAVACKEAGWEVYIACRFSKYKKAIEDKGFIAVPIKLLRNNKNPLLEIASILDIIRIYREVQPDIVHQVALKAVLYGSWAAWFTGVPKVINAIAGLGHVFAADSIKMKLLRPILLLALRTAFDRKKSKAIFQNPEDMSLLMRNGVVNEDIAVFIRGAGVDVLQYQFLPETSAVPVAVFASRMLWNKGAGDVVEATRILKKEGLQFRALLVGDPDPRNPMSIPEQVLRQWNEEGMVEWAGYKDCMPSVFAEASIVLLPTTYGEGIPKVLIEAAACGRPIIATDIPGCREIVRHQVNGLLIEPNSISALADAMRLLLSNKEMRERMGKEGRRMVVEEFSNAIIVSQVMQLYQEKREAASS